MCSLSLLAFLLSIALCRTQAPPRLVNGLRSSYTYNTAAARRILLCRFAGDPTPAVTWTFNGVSVPTSSDEGSLYYIPGNGTLVIERADSSNDGMYTCTGTNPHGSESESTELIFVRTGGAAWYVSWYMWFIYAIALWVLTIPLFIGWFFYRRKKADEDLPPPDGWIGN